MPPMGPKQRQGETPIRPLHRGALVCLEFDRASQDGKPNHWMVKRRSGSGRHRRDHPLMQAWDVRAEIVAVGSRA
eukprot:2246183-Pyramimonas_sp.AAC.1